MSDVGITVGVVGAARHAVVDRAGGLRADGARWALGWWIGAPDRWYRPDREVAVRQDRVDDAPVVVTAMRVAGGDAVERVYAAGGPGAVVVVEIENATPTPFVAALVVRGASRVAPEGRVIRVDDDVLLAPRAPSRWALTTDGSAFDLVAAGDAALGPPPGARDRRARIEAAFLHPVAHRTTLRLGLRLGAPTSVATDDAAELAALPSGEDVARGWRVQLDRGLRVELPEERLGHEVAAARAAVRLDASRPRPAPDAVAALEEWGFDDEAAAAWRALPGRGRRRAAARPAGAPSWDAVRRARDDGGPALLLALRRLLVHERADGGIDLLAELPPGWAGAGLAVHGAPTRRGPVSYAVRWHGARPALLWEAPGGPRLHAPGLDPDWWTDEPAGEVLLGGPGSAP